MRGVGRFGQPTRAAYVGSALQKLAQIQSAPTENAGWKPALLFAHGDTGAHRLPQKKRRALLGRASGG